MRFILFILLFSFHSEAQIIKSIRTSTGQFSGGSLSGAYDDGNVIMLGSDLHYMGGTDNSNVFNIHYKSTNKGVTWTALSNAAWSARNASGIAVSGGKIKFWGGNDYSGGLNDSWEYDDTNGWVQITSNMGATWGSRQSFAFVFTGTEYIGIGGNNKTDVVVSTNLTSWTVRGTLPTEIQNTGGMTAVYWKGALWLTSGQNNTTSVYPGKLFKSTDAGATWETVTTNSIFENKWGNITATNDALIYIKGHNTTGGNLKGTYYSTDGVSWTRMNYELGARHATPVCSSTDGTEAFAVTGNFYNDSWIFKRVD